jgi:hypothetical protein
MAFFMALCPELFTILLLPMSSAVNLKCTIQKGKLCNAVHAAPRYFLNIGVQVQYGTLTVGP